MEEPKTLTIAIIEDEPFSRLALKEILSNYPYHHKDPQRQVIYSELSIKVAGCTGNSEELLDLLKNDDGIEMLLLDYSLTSPEYEEDGRNPQDGAALIKSILHLRPELKIIVHTAHKSLAIARLAWQAGAWGFVQKNSNIQELFFAIYHIGRGKKFFPIELAELAQPTQSNSASVLSERELEVMRLLATTTMSQVDIAEHLHISFKTVSNTKTRAFKKLGITSKNDLYRYLNENPL